MQILVLIFVVFCMLGSSRAFIKSATRSISTSRALNMGLHDHSLIKLDGSAVNLSAYKGKVVLMENVATL